MRRILAAFFVLVFIFTALSAPARVSAADVNTAAERAASDANDANFANVPTVGMTVTLPRDNGIVDRVGIHVEALNPTVENGDDVVAHALVNAAKIDPTRFAWVAIARKVGTNTYTIIGVHEGNWNNTGTHGLEPMDKVVDCNTGGSDTYVTIIAGQKKGSEPRWDRSQEVILPVVNC